MHFGKPGLLIIILIANGVPGRAASPSLDMLIADKMLVQTFHAPFPALGHMEKDGQSYRFVQAPWSPAV